MSLSALDIPSVDAIKEKFPDLETHIIVGGLKNSRRHGDSGLNPIAWDKDRFKKEAAQHDNSLKNRQYARKKAKEAAEKLPNKELAKKHKLSLEIIQDAKRRATQDGQDITHWAKEDFENAAIMHQDYSIRQRVRAAQRKQRKKIKLSLESSEPTCPQAQAQVQAQEIVAEPLSPAQPTVTQPQQRDKKMAISYITSPTNDN